MEFQLQVPGRICLFGDNCDLLEEPCIAMAIAAQMTFEFRLRSDRRVVIVSEDLNRTEIFELGQPVRLSTSLRYVFAVYRRLFRRINSGFEIGIRSTIPIGVGMASSAALLVGTIRCLNRGFGLDLLEADIAEMAHVVERHDLLIECGRMDPYAVTFGGVTYIETGIPPHVTPLDIATPGKHLPMVVGNTGQPQDHERVRRALRARIEDRMSDCHPAMRRIVQIVNEGKEALEKGDRGRIAALMDESQVVERRMHNSTELIEAFCRTAKDAGALGAKQTGGSGTMVAFCPNRQNEVIEAIEMLGGKAFAYDVYYNPESEPQSVSA